jgi:amidase
MYAVPNVDKVISVADDLGIHLGPDEGVLYHKYVLEHLTALDAFVQARIDEETPPLCSPERGPGHRPTAAEDPLNAWMWMCDIPGAPEGLLKGKTVSFKDHTAVAGIPTSYGTFALDGFRPNFDATVVTRTLQAGGTVIGKNTMYGLSGGLSHGSRIGDYGRTLNPHNFEYSPGGSSSGSGAAVAAGEVDISFGGDQGGSIRIPAAYCGCFGMKPTFGLISHFGIGFGTDQSIDYTGPLARTVEDTAAALQATAGWDGYDPRQTRDVPLSMDVLSTLPNGVAGVRIGLLDEGFAAATPEIQESVLAAVDVLRRAGAVVSKISVPEHCHVRYAHEALMTEGALSLINSSYFGAFTRTYYPADVIAAIDSFWSAHADVLAPQNKLQLITAHLSRRNYAGRVYAKAQNVRPTYIKAYDTALSDVDVLVMPTTLTTAPKFEPVEGGYLDVLEHNLSSSWWPLAYNTAPFNFTGHPALAVPVGKSADRLPVSMQLVGRFFDDPLLLRVAYAYQHSVDWAKVISIGASAPNRAA